MFNIVGNILDNEMRVILVFFLFVTFFGCKPHKKEVSQAISPISSMVIDYATGFKVDYYDGFKIVTVTKPFMGSTDGFEYILTEDISNVPQSIATKNIIQIPLNSIVCTSTTHIPLLDYLEESDKLIGFPSTDYISSTKIRSRIDENLVTDLGVDKEMNIELLASIDPDLVMAYTIGGDYGQFNKIQQLGIPTVINAEYLEEHPLGRAEWIKFMAAFFNKENKADSIFKEIEKKYLDLKKKVTTTNNQPLVLSGVVYGDTWYLPGGQNYAAKLINDAGGHYIWSNNSASGFLELSFEAVYEKAYNADYWIGVASFETLESMSASDNRYEGFEAYKNKNVFTNNWRKGAKGGSEFLELGYLRPDIILADLIKILHPKLTQDEDLYFHKRLE